MPNPRVPPRLMSLCQSWDLREVTQVVIVQRHGIMSIRPTPTTTTFLYLVRTAFKTQLDLHLDLYQRRGNFEVVGTTDRCDRIYDRYLLLTALVHSARAHRSVGTADYLIPRAKTW